MNAKCLIIVTLIAGLSVSGLAGTHYVVPYGTEGVTPTPPYTNWPTAGTNLHDVVAAAVSGSIPRTVWVTNGVYYLTNEVLVSGEMTIRSVNGRDVTIVDGNNYPGKPVTNRCFHLNAGGVVLDGFTARNGCVVDRTRVGGVNQNGGGGIYCKSAAISVLNCRIMNCVNTNATVTSMWGGGITIGQFNVVSNCEVFGNTNFGAYGGGVYMANGLLTDSTVASNVNYSVYTNGVLTDNGNGGGVMLSESGVISNCTLYGNIVLHPNGNKTGYGGGVRISNVGGEVVNSLFFGNAAGTGGGIYTAKGGRIRNCTVANNQANSGGGVSCATSLANSETNYTQNVIGFYNTPGDCSLAGTGFFVVRNSCFSSTNFTLNGIYANNTQSDPKFLDKAGYNYRLAKGSPCIDSGLNAGWGTGALDLDGNRRIDPWSGVIDMGCFEYTVAHGTLLQMY